MFQAENVPERGMFKAKEAVTGEEPGEEVLDIGEQAGLFGSSDFLLRALRGLQSSYTSKDLPSPCPPPCYLSPIRPPDGSLSGCGAVHCKGARTGPLVPGVQGSADDREGTMAGGILGRQLGSEAPRKPQPTAVAAGSGCYEDEG